MTDSRQEERLDYLLRKFKEDSVRYRDLEVGDDYMEKRTALRSDEHPHARQYGGGCGQGAG